MDSLEKGLQHVKGVGPVRLRDLQRLGLHTVRDLLYHVPRAYHDRRQLKKIAELGFLEEEAFLARVKAKKTVKTSRKGKAVALLTVSDGSGTADLVFFQSPYVLKSYSLGEKLLIYGKAELFSGRITVKNAEIERWTENKFCPVLPVYPSSEGLSQNFWRKITANVLQDKNWDFTDYLPDFIRQKYHLPGFYEALKDIHFPGSLLVKERARKRLAFDELFLFQLGILSTKQIYAQKKRSWNYLFNDTLTSELKNSLPFILTKAQQGVIREIKADLRRNYPMNRLLQGDVGSGKTITAAFALAFALESGLQAALMAPTEVLAEQHFKNLSQLFQPLGIKTVLLTGNLTKKQKEQSLELIKSGQVQLIIGTHALIQDKVMFKNLALAVIDEQHRFGVLQRAALADKGLNPDILIMTATPIPRTLSLTVYGDLEVSVLDELPPGRQEIVTKSLENAYRAKVYDFIRRKVREGRQVYFVCPLVEESEKLSLQAAIDLAAALQEEVFSDFSVGLLHGRMKAKEKEAVMQLFKAGKLQILVSTTVIEVGIDVPNATIMVIENSERFGLSQLHQLRGRVGRGKEQSYCFLLHEKDSQRLKVMTETSDGFKIAEKDLQLRGPGEFLGVKQHGFWQFRIANLALDEKILQAARNEALALLAEAPLLEGYDELKKAADSVICCLGERRN